MPYLHLSHKVVKNKQPRKTIHFQFLRRQNLTVNVYTVTVQTNIL